jgi:hypothetical protein
MDMKRLFHVLVIGGSVAAGCERSRTGALNAADGAGLPDVGMPESAAAEDAALEAPVAVADAAASEVTSMNVDAAADAAAAKDAADGPAGDPCLCSATKCCDVHDGAPATVQAGLYCCWGSTC